MEIAWQAWDMVRVSVGEDASCVESCRRGHFHDSIAAFRKNTIAQGAMLPSSFVPVCVAGAMLGDVATCHPRLEIA